MPHTHRNSPAKIGIDYSSALRPKAPAFSAPKAEESGMPFFARVLVGCGLAVILLVVVGVLLVKVTDR